MSLSTAVAAFLTMLSEWGCGELNFWILIQIEHEGMFYGCVYRDAESAFAALNTSPSPEQEAMFATWLSEHPDGYETVMTDLLEALRGSAESAIQSAVANAL